MKDRLFRLISIESAEESRVTMLLWQSVFLGIFYGTFDVSAHSIFLSVFDEKMLARAYVVSGFAGIILSFLYSRCHTRFQFRNFAVANLLFITAVTLILWILLLLYPVGWVIFLVFILLGPLNILAISGFRGTISRMLTHGYGKNHSGLIEGGTILGIIISCFAIPVLLSLGLKLHYILLSGAAAAFAGTVIQVLAGRRFLLGSGESPKAFPAFEAGKPQLHIFRENNYVRIIAVFTALSVMTLFFIQYSFMAITRIQYPSAEDMARFLGLFTGSMMIFTLIAKFLVFPFLLRNFRLSVCLVIPSVLIALITVAVVVTGFILGYAPAAEGFLLFFILLALSRFFSRSLKESIEFPAVKVILQCIDERIRYAAEYGMSVIVNEIAVFLSGLVLAGLGALSFVKLIHFPVVLIVIAVLWMVAAFRVYSGYRDSVRRTCKTNGQEGPAKSPQPEFTELKNRFTAEITFANEYFSLINGDLSSLERNDNRWFLIKILDHAHIKEDINLLPVLKKIRAGTGIEMEIRQRSSEIITNLDNIISGVREKHDRTVSSMMMLADSHQPQKTDVLRLLRDMNLSLRNTALCIIRKFRMTDMIPEVCECLDNPALESQAASVLKDFGREADEALRRFYFRSSANIDISKMILRLLGTTCNRENEEFLFSLLWSGPWQIRETAMKSLADCNYPIREDEKERLLHLISEVAGVLTWTLSARITIKGENDPLLNEAVKKEIDRWNSILFNLLSITYGAGYVNSIRENIRTGTVESVSHALEMIDIVMDESVRIKIKSLFDTVSDKEKVRILRRFFPGEIDEYEQLAEKIINRDYNLLGVWIRACIIRNMPDVKDGTLAQSLIALLFSPEMILREETAKLLSRSSREFYMTASDRIPVEAKGRLESIINGTVSDSELLYNKVRFLESILHGLPEENLFFLADEIRYSDKLGPELLPVLRDSVLWQFNNGVRAKILHDDVLTEIAGQDSDAFFYILSLDAVEKYYYKFPDYSFEILRYINEIE
jgi:AAA family ATP:ADP antiporter